MEYNANNWQQITPEELAETRRINQAKIAELSEIFEVPYGQPEPKLSKLRRVFHHKALREAVAEATKDFHVTMSR